MSEHLSDLVELEVLVLLHDDHLPHFRRNRAERSPDLRAGLVAEKLLFDPRIRRRRLESHILELLLQRRVRATNPAPN